ncbi:MAG: class I SAM-dependent methyltransferase, partial [Candidatus Omnitrophica bacterium]|nr:class I SAM-dependent methyltransferase [Candidatus Omnitrophota bacterium]
LGKGSIAGNKVRVYTIDPHRDTSAHKVFGTPLTYEEFKKNIQVAGINEIIFPIVKTSAEAVKIFNEPIELLFIDGEHEYEMVKLDFELWYPKVAYGGFIVFHDRGFSGPRGVINKYIYRSKHFKDIGIVDALLFAQKVRKNSIRDRIINIFLFFINTCVSLYYNIHIRKRPLNITSRVLKALKIMK